ncbi:MAG TPA: gas vesicle protein GvpD P-loop domain-containing protein [Thermoplasmata archaeon]|nr:gas vesicle protein GvpD P-loop domain-containing protein [Thermoplasmata archaeon]
MPDPRATAFSGESHAELMPPELRHFLSGRTIGTLVVRGAPGVGKTTFALGALAAFEGVRTLLTTRVPTETLLQQFPWLGDGSSPPVDLIEFVRFRTISSVGSLSVDHLRQTLQARASDLVDVSQVLNLPPIVADHIARQASGPRLIAIDSWEAYVENVLGSSTINLDAPTTRWELERGMLDQLLATGSSVLLVVERDERSRFDYIVDGSILLASQDFDGREERWLEISKLRGVRIRSRSYPFTLEGARFRALMGTSTLVGPPGRADPDPDPSSPDPWPGSAQFAEPFGRLPTGGPMLIETDTETPARATWRLVLPMVEATLVAGGRVVVRPPTTLSPSEVWSSFPQLLPSTELVRSLRIVAAAGAAPPPPDAPPEIVLGADGPTGAEPTGSDRASDDPAREFSPEAARAIEFLGGAPSGRRNLVVVFPSVRADVDPRRGPDEYLRLLGQVRRDGARFAGIVVMSGEDPLIGSLRGRAPVHLNVRTRRGQIFVFGVRPWSPSFLLDLSSHRGGRTGPYQLRAMV